MLQEILHAGGKGEIWIIWGGGNHLGKCLKWLPRCVILIEVSGSLKQNLISLEMIEIKNVWNIIPMSPSTADSFFL